MVLLKKTLQQNSRSASKAFDKVFSSTDSNEYQYLQQSNIPTLHFQSALPRLPIPKLKLTCERYLAAQKPLLINESYQKTEANVKQFRDGLGQQLQKYLKEYDNENKNSSYISELWFDKYLTDRKPLPLNYNPVLVLHNDERADYNSQLIRTTNMIISSVRFYKSLKSNILEPEMFHLNPKKTNTKNFNNICSKLPSKLAYIYAYLNKVYPLDMNQYPNLFNTTRIPEIDKDRLFTDTNAKHISVQYKGNFYTFNVLSQSGDLISPEVILNNIKFILNSEKSAAEFPIGVLTTLNRNEWATIRHLLLGNGNAQVLKMIDSALFNVCLDEQSPGNDPYTVTKLFLHGDGTNRWFDKSFSLIVAKDGAAAINFEHAWGDGVAVLRYAQDIFKDSKEKPRVSEGAIGKISDEFSVQFLDIKLDDQLKHSIIEARQNYKKTCDNLDVNYTVFEGTGKEICKQSNVSPDAIMQLAFQVAYHKLTNSFVSTYESCSTAAFKRGRTETIRPCTMSTKEFTLSINKRDKPSVSELKNIISKCSAVHNRLIKEAAMGQGFDRHLFALKCMGLRHNIRSNIFDDPEYAHINYDILSTSTLNSPAIFAGGFAPVVNNGFGIAYVIKDAYLGALVTSYKDANQNGKSFVDALKTSIEEIFSILKTK